jgi:hypothetical protein
MKVIRKENETFMLLPENVLHVTKRLDNETIKKMEESNVILIEPNTTVKWIVKECFTYDENEVEVIN